MRDGVVDEYINHKRHLVATIEASDDPLVRQHHLDQLDTLDTEFLQTLTDTGIEDLTMLVSWIANYDKALPSEVARIILPRLLDTVYKEIDELQTRLFAEGKLPFKDD